MRLTRRPRPSEATRTLEPLDLTAVPTRDLYHELKRRDWEVWPAGALEAVIAERQAKGAQAARAEAAAAEKRREQSRQLAELGRLAGDELPKAVARVIELGEENSVLRDRAYRAETEADLMGAALVAPMIAEMRDDEER